MPVLKRTQMYLPEGVLRELKKKAGEEKTTVAGIVRSAVAEFLGKKKTKHWENDPLWNMVGTGSSKDGDLSVRHDKYLYGKK